MHTKPSANDFLLLSYCYLAGVPLSLLLRKGIGESLNLPYHGLNELMLVRKLCRIVDREWLVIWEPGTEIAMPKRAATRVLRGTADGLDAEAGKLVIALSSTGGGIWEEYATPDWSAFVDYELSKVVDDHIHLVFRSSTRRTIDLVADLVAYWGGFQRAGMNVLELTGWRPLYWKKLRRGYELLVNTGATPHTPLGEKYAAGVFALDGRLPEIYAYLSSHWRLKFFLRMQEQREL